MNDIAANVITNLTSSMRFEGSLNVDLNEITTNLVPFPRMHYLMSSTSPAYDKKYETKRMDQVFTDAFSRSAINAAV
jgi:tubulin epsilon